MKDLFLVLIACAWFVQCNNVSRPINYTSFSNFRELLKPEAFDNFPLNNNDAVAEAKESIIIFPASVEAFGYCGAIFSFKLSDEEYNRRVSQFPKLYDFVGIKFDSSNLLALKEKDNFTFYESELFPLPPLGMKGFEGIKNDSIKSFGYFNSKTGLFLRDSTYMTNSIDLGREFKDGTSSGFFLKPESNEIIYWIIVW